MGTRDTYNAQGLLFVQPQFAEHLVTLFHHEGAFVGVGRDVAVHLKYLKIEYLGFR
jgi:hypothetical protein